MSWDGVERRRDTNGLETRLAQVSNSLAEITGRLEAIEASINKVEGAWLFAKYILAIPAALWAFYEWFKNHIV